MQRVAYANRCILYGLLTMVNAANAATETVNTFECARQPPKIIAPSLGELEFWIPMDVDVNPPKRYLDRFSHFCRAYERGQQT